MSDRDITVWLDERWYHALSKQLGEDETLEDKLGDYLDKLCNQLPRNVYDRISREIFEEIQQRKAEQQATLQEAIFKVTDRCETHYYEVHRWLEFLDAARLLRRYLRGECGASRFEQMIWNAKEISAERFSELADLRMQNTGQVTGAFDMDFDRQQISALNIMDGWETFTMQDVSTAVYHADRKNSDSTEIRWQKFLSHLDGKALRSSDPAYLSGTDRLSEKDISFAEDVIRDDGRLNFYMEVVFDPDKVFGINVCTAENDDYVNVYANYDLEAGKVCEDLEIILVQDDTDIEYRYRLTPEEQELFRQKMDGYCLQHWGQNLEDCQQEYMSEVQSETSGPEMQL